VRNLRDAGGGKGDTQEIRERQVRVGGQSFNKRQKMKKGNKPLWGGGKTVLFPFLSSGRQKRFPGEKRETLQKKKGERVQ